MRKESTTTQLRLALVRVVEDGDVPSLALQRRGERLQKYDRAEDAALGVSPACPPPAPAQKEEDEEDDPFAWAKADSEDEEEEEEDDDDPFAWAKADIDDEEEEGDPFAWAASPPQPEVVEEEDPFAWAAAGAPGGVSARVAEAPQLGDEVEGDVDDMLSDDYLEDKYG